MDAVGGAAAELSGGGFDDWLGHFHTLPAGLSWRSALVIARRFWAILADMGHFLMWGLRWNLAVPGTAASPAACCGASRDAERHRHAPHPNASQWGEGIPSAPGKRPSVMADRLVLRACNRSTKAVGRW